MSLSTIAPCAVLLTTLLQNATGKMPYSLTNDYFFRATLQRSKGGLKGLICAILGLKPEEILSVEITNPIELGKSIHAKDFILDIRILLNNHTTINMEMQVLNLGNWPERSLGYLCRSFDSLNKGDDYIETKPVIQVCFLDFTLFKDAPEFFSKYMFMNVKSHLIYSDKLKLFVVDLTQIDIATEDDKLRGIDNWARLFKATTWEEIKMLAKNDNFLAEAAETAYQLSTEETIRMQCEAREDFYRQQRYIQKKLEKLELMESLEQKNCELQKNNSELQKNNSELQKSNAEKDFTIAEKDRALSAKDEEIARLKAMLDVQNTKNNLILE